MCPGGWLRISGWSKIESEITQVKFFGVEKAAASRVAAGQGDDLVEEFLAVSW